MNDYTVRDKEHYGEMDIAKKAYPKFQEKLEICQNLFYCLSLIFIFHIAPPTPASSQTVSSRFPDILHSLPVIPHGFPILPLLRHPVPRFCPHA